MDLRTLFKRVIVTERTTKMQALGQQVLAVHESATKGQIREIVSQIFDVDVIKVRTLNVKGKTCQRGMGRKGKKPDWKKAIVTLKPGQEIKVGEEPK